MSELPRRGQTALVDGQAQGRSAHFTVVCDEEYPKILPSSAGWNTGSPWAYQSASLLKWRYNRRAPHCRRLSEAEWSLFAVFCSLPCR